MILPPLVFPGLSPPSRLNICMQCWSLQECRPLHQKGKLLALSTKIRQGWKKLAVTILIDSKTAVSIRINQLPVSAARWQHWVPHMFCNVCAVKNHKSAKYSITTGARENISTNLESLEFKNFFYVCLIKFRYNQILHNKISRNFVVTVWLLPRWNFPIANRKKLNNPGPNVMNLFTAIIYK